MTDDTRGPLAIILDRDTQVCSAILRTMSRLGFATPAETYTFRVTDATNDLRQALQDACTERDALRAQIEALTSDKAVEAACVEVYGVHRSVKCWKDEDQNMMEAALAAARDAAIISAKCEDHSRICASAEKAK